MIFLVDLRGFYYSSVDRYNFSYQLSILFSQDFFLNLDLFMVALCSSFVIKGASLARTYFLLIGTCLLKMQKTVSLKHFNFFSEAQL